jgi:hypothetical protein
VTTARLVGLGRSPVRIWGMFSNTRTGLMGVMIVFPVSGIWLLVAFAPKYALAATAYACALLAGLGLAAIRRTGILLPVLVVAVVVAPRVVQRPFPDVDFTTGNERVLALLAFAAVGAAAPIAARGAERLLVIIPVALVTVGIFLNPSLLLEASFGWLAASGALFVLGRRWVTKRGGALLLAFIIGVTSIYFKIPGFRGEIGILPSDIRSFGVFGNPLIAADAIMFMTAGLVAIWWRNGFAVLVLVTAGLVAIVETGSRTGLLLAGFLAVALVTGKYPLANGARRSAGRNISLALLTTATLAVLFLSKQELGRVAAISGQEGSVTARVAAIGDGLVASLTHPFGGDEIVVTSSAGQITTYENLFFDVGARLGLLALAGVVVAFAIAYRLGNQAGRVGVAVMILAGMTAAIYYHPAAYVLGLVCAGVIDSVAQREDAPNVGDEGGLKIDPTSSRSISG